MMLALSTNLHQALQHSFDLQCTSSRNRFDGHDETSVCPCRQRQKYSSQLLLEKGPGDQAPRAKTRGSYSTAQGQGQKPQSSVRPKASHINKEDLKPQKRQKPSKAPDTRISTVHAIIEEDNWSEHSPRGMPCCLQNARFSEKQNLAQLHGAHAIWKCRR